MTFTYNFNKGCDTDHEIIKRAKTQPISLYAAFTWDATPQGQDYWFSRAHSQVPLSDDDHKYLDWLLTQPDRLP